MSALKKIQDEHRESKFGYVYAVSGPGKYKKKIISFKLSPWNETEPYFFLLSIG